MHADAWPTNTTGGIVQPPDEQMAYTVKNAARTLDLSERYVWELVIKGAIESVKIGRSRRIPRAALESYLQGLRGIA